MKKFNIADVKIEIASHGMFELNRLDNFLSEETSAYDIKVEIIKVVYINRPKGKVSIDESLIWLDSMSNSEEYISYISNKYSDEVIIMLKLSKKLDRAVIYYREDYMDNHGLTMELFIEVLLRFCSIKKNGFSIHAAAINYNEKGILFTAPSGTGKSTQAKLWEKYRKAEILNDDRPVIRMKDGKWYVYGTPWSGSDLPVLNKSVQLSAIIAIKQSAENRIRRLTSREAVNYVMARCFLPYFDQKLMDIFIEHIGSVIQNIPVYLLNCRPDEEAVELVNKCLELN